MNKKNCGKQGQVAVVLIVVAAVAIILYAVSLNLGKIAQNKAQTTLAVNSSASLMASEMTSYAESLFQTSLGGPEGTGGDLTVSGWTGVVGAILTLIAVIIAVIIVVATYGWGTQVAIALVLAVAAVAIQIAVVQPGITSLWNKMMEGLTPPDQFVERGVQTGLQTSVADQALVDDDFDTDLDGLFGSADRVNRFGVFYAERLKQQNTSRADAIENFLNELEKFIFGYSKYDEPPFDPDGEPRAWSLWDPLCDVYTDHPCCQDRTDPNVVLPSECNPCCLPETVSDSRSGVPMNHPIRPSCCDAADGTYCGTASTCAAHSLYGEDAPWVYNAYYEDYSNNCPEMDHIDPDTGAHKGCYGRPPSPQFLKHISFKEVLGRDDEHGSFKAIDPHKYEHNSGFAIAQVPTGPFLPEDTRSFNIVYEDPRSDEEFLTPGTLYDFLWAMGDIQADLSKVDPDNTDPNDLTDLGSQCYWCDSRMTPPATGEDHCDPDPGCTPPILGENNCCTCNSDNAGLEGLEDCTEEVERWDGTMIPYPGECTFCVDKTVDRVRNLKDFFAKFDECAIGPIAKGEWKKGADRFCSDEWPYENGCTKHRSCWEFDDEGNIERRDCVCGEDFAGDARFWQDDTIDLMVYGLNEFIGWSVELLKYDRKIAIQNFDAWIESARSWIAPNFNFDERGELIKWRDQTQGIRGSITEWLENDYSVVREPESAFDIVPPPTCDQTDANYVWCVPPAGCKGVSQAEEDFWGVAGTGSNREVKLDNVLSCLYYNAVEDGGNDDRFFACGNKEPGPDPDNPLPTCSPETCADLPRSLLGDEFYDYVYTCDADGENCQPNFDPGYPEDVEAFQTCLNSINNGTCSEATCGDLPSETPDGASYNIPEFSDGQGNDFTRCLARCTTERCQPLVGQGEPPVPSFTAPGPDYETLNDCAEGFCSPGGFSGDCRSSLLFPSFQGIPQDCNADSAYMAAVRAERDAQAGSCLAGSEFLQAVAANADSGEEENSCTDPDFQDAVEDALCEAEGSCCDPDWLDLMERSHILARNQTVQFKHRYDYLLERQAQAERLDGRFGEALGNFTRFLNGPAKDLLAAANLPEEDAPLPNKVIYGWKTDPAPGKDRGYWHLVRVDARLPGRCEGQCGKNGAIEPSFPTIKTYTRHWGTRRYYSLGDSFGQPGCNNKSDYKKVNKCFKGGMVKARVVRYDEDKDELTFPNTIPIWRSVFHHPGRDSADPSMLDNCEGFGIGNKEGPAGAFMLNGSSTSPQCWQMANNLLERGLVSQTCAEYFYHKPPFSSSQNQRGFSLKFVNCSGGLAP